MMRLLLFAAALAVPSAKASFVDEGASRGIQPYSQAPLMGSGVAASDFDDDGDIDLFVPTAGGHNHQLYINDGQGQFREAAAEHGLASPASARVALWLDVDNDCDLDLVVASDCFGLQSSCAGEEPMLRLYRQQEDRSFTDVTAQSGFAELAQDFEPFDHRGGLAAADFDRDGDLDLVASVWDTAMPGSAVRSNALGRTRFYRNDQGTFVDATAQSGLVAPVRAGDWQPLVVDANRDGWPDLFMPVDFGPNRLHLNQSDGTFTDIAADAGVAFAATDGAQSGWNDMGAVVGDVDNDGDFDVFTTNIANYTAAGEHNLLFRADSTAPVRYSETAIASGVGSAGWGWGASFFDDELDGDLDLAVTNGFTDPGHVNDSSCLFRNFGTAFVEDGANAGFADRYWGSSVVAADLDRDGDIDLVQTTKEHPGDGPLRVLIRSNDGNGGWLRVEPRGQCGRLHWPIGAIVHVHTGQTMQSRMISAGSGFLSQEPAEAHFGLGAAARVDEVTVTWPDGRQTRRFNVFANTTLRILDDELWVDSFE